MDGITILAKHFCRGIELEGLIVNLIIFSLLTAFALIFYVCVIKFTDDKLTKNTAFACLVIAVLIFVWFVVFEIKQYHDTHMEYTITIDDSVGFNEFYNKYEIISVNDKEYRVIEKHT